MSEPQFKKVNKNNKAFRRALLEVYNFSCFYTGQPIDFDTLQVDHIIPKSLMNEPVRLKEYLRQLDMPMDFELDSVLNLVPCKGRINLEKADSLFEISTARYFLDKARKNSNEVFKRLAQHRKSKPINSSLEDLREAVQGGHKAPTEVYDYVSGDKQPFDVFRSINIEPPGTKQFIRSTPAVRLEGYIPTYEKMKGECEITFRSLKIRDCTISLTHEQILSNLFEGLYSSPVLDLRRFISFRSKQSSDMYFIDLESNRFPLSKHEVGQLCEIVDDYAQQYLQGWREIEKILGLYLFEKSQSHEYGYRMVKIKRNLWKSMINFTFKFDFAKGQSEWHMFDQSRAMIKVYSSFTGSRYDEGYHAFFEPEPVEQVDYTSSDDEVWIVWNPHLLLLDKPLIIGGRAVWDALTAYNWLVEEFIPRVLSVYKAKNYMEVGRMRNYLPLDQITSISDLYEFVSSLQEFYNANQKHYFITASQMQSLYTAIIICLEKVAYANLHYICSKLWIEQKDTLSEIIAELEIRKSNLIDAVVASSKIDLMLRPMVAALRENKRQLRQSEVQEIVMYLTPFVERQNLDEAIERAQMRKLW